MIYAKKFAAFEMSDISTEFGLVDEDDDPNAGPGFDDDKDAPDEEDATLYRLL